MKKIAKLIKGGSLVLTFLIFSSAGIENKKPVLPTLPILGTCQPVKPASGFIKLTEQYYYFEASSGVTLKISRGAIDGDLTLTFGYVAYPNFSYQLWGSGYIGEVNNIYTGTHENLNGKHLKDRLGDSRTIIFPNGTKITMVSTGDKKSITAISIYSGAMAHHLNITCNKIEYSAYDLNVAQQLDAQQADGETSTLELTETGLIFYNIYNEATPGNKIHQRVDLGSLSYDNPNQVNDLFDDPRLGHT